MNLIKKVFYGSKLNSLLLSAKEKYVNEFNLGAINDYTSAIEIDNKNIEAIYNRGKIYFETDNYVDALKDFIKLNEINPNYEPKQDYYLAKSYEKLGKYKEAGIYADKYLEQNKDNVKTKYFAARIKYLNEEYDEALNLINELLNLYPEDFNVRCLRSLINFSKTNFVEAILDTDKAIEISAVHPFVFNLRGLININRTKYSEALEDFDYAIRLNPEVLIYQFNKAKLLFNMDNFDEANNILDNILKIDDEDKPAILLKAEINTKQEKFPEALEQINNVLREDPENIILLKKKAILLSKLHDYQAAKKALTKACDLGGNNPGCLIELAYLEIKLDEPEKALENLQKVVEIDKENQDALLQKGIMEIYLDKYEDAVNTFDKLLLFDPTNERVRLYKAKAYFKLGEKEKMEDEIDKISDSTKEADYFLITSKNKLEQEKIEEAEDYIERAYLTGNYDSRINLIRNVLKIETGKISEIDDISIISESDKNKFESEILTAILNFEKGNYNSTLSHLSNLDQLEKEKEELLKPILEYADAIG